MKKILIALFVCATAFAQAQSLQPKGTQATVIIATNDVAGADTIKLYPSEWQTIVRPASNIVDSVVYKVASTFRSNLGDNLIFTFTNSAGSGHYVRLTGANFAVTGSDSTIALTASKRATIRFTFDGVKWMETSIIKQ